MALNFENINRISPWVTNESLQILNFKKIIYCNRFCFKNHQNYLTNWFILSEGHCAECFTYVDQFKPHKFKW